MIINVERIFVEKYFLVFHIPKLEEKWNLQ